MMNDGTFHFTLKNDYDEIWKIKINVKKRELQLNYWDMVIDVFTLIAQ